MRAWKRRISPWGDHWRLSFQCGTVLNDKSVHHVAMGCPSWAMAEWHEAEVHGRWHGPHVICRLRSDDYNSAQFWVHWISPTPYTLSLSELIHSHGFKYDKSASDFKVYTMNSKPTYLILYSDLLGSLKATSTPMCPNWTPWLPLHTNSFLISVNGPTIYCCSRQKLGGYPWCFILLHLPIKNGLPSHVVLCILS